MAIDFNSDPYYDDFSDSNNYYRILFKPGRAVQARELTQLQTILQNQITKFGKNIYKDGSPIVGGKTFVRTGSYIKIKETTNIDAFVGATVIGSTSGAKAVVRKITTHNTTNNVYYPAALHIVYISGQFLEDETITIQGTTTAVSAIADSATYTGPTTFFSVDESVFFVKGHFVYAAPQTVVVSPRFVRLPSARLGFKVTEGITTSDDDSALLDPAIGSTNYFAPGADRYFIDLTLTSIEFDPTVENSDVTTVNDFIQVCTVREGSVINSSMDTQFNSIETAMARRTYDESGDYTVRPFIAKVRNHVYGNTSKLSVEVSPGKAYVRGYEFETTAPSYITLDKARDTNSVNGYSIALDYGRYIPVWNVNNFVAFTEAQLLNIHDIKSGSISVSSNAAYSANIIGTARARYMSYAGAVGTGNVYNLYLFDVRMLGSNTFSKANAFSAATYTSTPTLTVKGDTFAWGNAAFTYSRDDTFLFNVPQKNIKTFSNVYGVGTSVTDTTYSSIRNFASTAFAPGTGIYSGNSVATISLAGNEQFLGSGNLSDTAIRDRFIATVTVSGTGTPPVGSILDFTGANGDIEIVGQNAYLRYKGSTSTFTANVMALVSASQATSKVKTLTNGSVVVPNGTSVTNISLNVPDVFKVISITDATGNSYLSSYQLDTGQRDDYYDHGSISLKTGGRSPVLHVTNNPNVTINFQYFEHTGTGFFNVDSYTNGGLDYGSIPQYTKSSGEVVNLADVIDFRPVREANKTTFLSDRSPKPGSVMTADYEYYLPRKDKLVLTKERKITIAKGISGDSPSYPGDLQDALALYNIDIPPYTRLPQDVQFTYIDNKRFTMRDIGRIEKRVGRLEYYSALSLLEKIAADEKIPSGIAGIDRFKNGILVDSFAGHSVSDVNNGDLRCSIDYENRLLRPRFISESYLYAVSAGESSSYKKSFDLVTMDYTTLPFVSQTKATNTTYLTPFEVFTWTGTMTLTPSTDVWADTITNPTVTVNLNGENDAFTQITLDNTGLSPWGTRWNDWQSVFRGLTDVSVDVSAVTNVSNDVQVDKTGKISVTPTARTDVTTSVTKTTQESFARTGLQFSSAAKTITAKLGEKVVDSSIIPFIRSRPIIFSARNLKPDTQLFATFDGIDVTSYCTPAVSVQFLNTLPNNITQLRVLSGATTVSLGDVISQRGNVLYMMPNVNFRLPQTGNVATLVAETTTTATITGITVSQTLRTDATGGVAGRFTIPNNNDLKFNLGERAFKLADTLDKRFITTVAETKYLAYGLSQTKEDTILATRMNLVSIDPLLEVKKSAAETSVSRNTNIGVSTVGTSNQAQLPPPIPSFTQTLFCGEAVATTGQQGVHNFMINLGLGVGPANISCWTGIIPDRFTLIYKGQEITTGFMTTSSDSGVNATNTARLKDIGYPEITRAGCTLHKIEFIKQEEGIEFATLRVDAPLRGTGWNFNINCPSGTATPAPGTARIDLSDNRITVLSADFGDAGRNAGAQTAQTDLGIRCTITNTATDQRWSKAGTDKTIYITALNLQFAGAQNEGTATIVTTGTGQGVYNGTLYPTKTAETWTNTLGTLPVLLQPGESRTFTIRLAKTATQRTNGTLTVAATITGPGTGGGQAVSQNTPTIDIQTRVESPPEPVDPLAQTFFVEARDFPNGLFLDSVDLWFNKKDDLLPCSVEIRPVVNGYPSSTEIIPFAYAVKDSFNITASTTFNINNNTNFKFPAPVYLPKGQYALVIRGNSKNYIIYSASLGEFRLDAPDIRVTDQPYVGSMFKSQNASTWTADQGMDITFRLNRCKFSTTTPTAVILNSVAPANNVEYDVFFTTGETLQFADTAAQYAFKTTSNSTGALDSSFRGYLLGTNYGLEERKAVKSSTPESLKFNVLLSTTDSTISPVIDLERLSSVLIRNIINNDATGENSYSGGNAAARYITRRVTLNPGFEAKDMKVYLNAYCPGPSSIKVYYKVNAPGTTQFDSENKYVEMTSTSIVGDTKAGFAEYTFSTASGQCLPDGADFSTFVVKIVMLSSDTTQVPIVRDLRVLALDA